MRKIYSGKSQYLGASTTRTLHTGPGKVYAILATTNSATPASATLSDNTTLLFSGAFTSTSPLIIFFPQNTPLVFTTSLVAVTGAGALLFVITEAEA